MLHQIKAQPFYDDIGQNQLCQFLQETVEPKDFSRLLSDFSRQIKFSRTFQESPLNSSTFQACANPANEK